MSGTFGPTIPQPPFPIVGPVRDGEAVAPAAPVLRTINTQPDLGQTDGPGNITSLSAVTVTIARQDGQTISNSDVSLVPSHFSLDATGYLLTLAFQVPAGLPYAPGASSIVYVVTIYVYPTSGGQPWKRDGLLTAVPVLG